MESPATNTSANAKSQQNLDAKFSEFLKKNEPAPQTAPKVGVSDIEKSEQLIRKRFWKTVILFLAILPVITGIGIFAYQKVLDYKISNATPSQTPQVTIDPRQVVTPEALPFSSDVLIPGWQRQAVTEIGYAFQYPNTWFVKNVESKEFQIQSQDPNSPVERTVPVGSITFTALSSQKNC
jgi:hypothetical protein